MANTNSEIPKFYTVEGTWVSALDVSDPDQLMDPSDYYEWLTSEDKMSLGYATQDDIDDYQEEMEEKLDDEGDSDDYEDLDDLFFF